MAYFGGDPMRPGGLGCGNGCGCPACARAGRRLGETYEPDDDDDDDPPANVRGLGEDAATSAPTPAMGRRPATPAMGRLVDLLRGAGAAAVLRQLLADGVRDENRMTDLLFMARHPERQGRRIAGEETAAAREWLALRQRWVRPALQRRPPASPAPGAAGQPAAGAACAIEDPLPRLRHPTGTPCGAAGRKCWPELGKSLDIVDADLPCTRERSPGAYRAVLKYFNVADSANLRYARTPTATYCNIFAHDATRALQASIPHWVRDEHQRSPPVGWNEMNANATFDWLLRSGQSAGWFVIGPEFIAAVQRLADSRGIGRAVAVAAVGLPRALADAVGRIATARHDDPGLLAQDSYLAQQLANQGLPTVVSWKNPNGRAGHIALVAPESPGSVGVRHPSGMYLPRTTQAGARNFEDGLDAWITGPGTRARRFFVHP